MYPYWHIYAGQYCHITCRTLFFRTWQSFFARFLVISFHKSNTRNAFLTGSSSMSSIALTWCLDSSVWVWSGHEKRYLVRRRSHLLSGWYSQVIAYICCKAYISCPDTSSSIRTGDCRFQAVECSQKTYWFSFIRSNGSDTHLQYTKADSLHLCTLTSM